MNFSELSGQFNAGKQDVFPAVVLNSDGLTTIAESQAWVKQHQAELEQQLALSGTILFRGFPIASAEDFDQFTASFGYPNFLYKDSLSNAVRINFTERVFTANEAPKEVEIYLHNEMAQTPIYPDKIFFSCLAPADKGGYSPILRGDLLFNALAKSNSESASAFAEKGVKYTTIMPSENDPASGQGRSWKSTLNVTSLEQAEQKLARLGYSWQWLEDGSLKATTAALPAVRTLDCGRKVFFNQLIAAYMGWRGVREHHQDTLCFGDDSAIPKQWLEEIVALSNDYIFDVPWQAGDVALVDNNLAMHGRRPYSGDRKRQVLVALGAAKTNA
ncbi:TauD/TfdA family dioxygenase [Rheinheimera sp. UJ51]|uniref:TauD/TfdA family dioxygenase n=1 Tax=Rheinheimera sp. UJ51 TaxID=2892446 RepID=UPI001E35FB1A|nr:TauD/TfdA family dioxygenase [Rheinheimera sp. UJ51]MCC5452906.1 TauD/TfdA family dioxygenase [Rheinheimera sp. UJ51]